MGLKRVRSPTGYLRLNRGVCSPTDFLGLKLGTHSHMSYLRLNDLTLAKHKMKQARRDPSLSMKHL
jgi:hypothetical protein